MSILLHKELNDHPSCRLVLSSTFSEIPLCELKDSLQVCDLPPPSLLTLTFEGLAGSTNLSFEGSIRRRKKIEDDWASCFCDVTHPWHQPLPPTCFLRTQNQGPVTQTLPGRVVVSQINKPVHENGDLIGADSDIVPSRKCRKDARLYWEIPVISNGHYHRHKSPVYCPHEPTVLLPPLYSLLQ